MWKVLEWRNVVFVEIEVMISVRKLVKAGGKENLGSILRFYELGREMWGMVYVWTEKDKIV
jgi:hypothetical protein